MNRPARFKTVDALRAIRAAEKAGREWGVEIDPDGTIRLVRTAGARPSSAPRVAPIEEVVF